MSDEQVIGAVAARTGSLHSGAHARTHSLPFAAPCIEHRDSAISGHPMGLKVAIGAVCSDGVLRNVRQCVSAEVGIRIVSELCHIPPETLGKHRLLRGHADAHRCCGKSLIGECVGGFRCASARASGINFQACSFNHSDISPFRINELQSVRNSVAQNLPSRTSDPRCRVDPVVCRYAQGATAAELCQTF
jgi:hypothetical protein